MTRSPADVTLPLTVIWLPIQHALRRSSPRRSSINPLLEYRTVPCPLQAPGESRIPCFWCKSRWPAPLHLEGFPRHPLAVEGIDGDIPGTILGDDVLAQQRGQRRL